MKPEIEALLGGYSAGILTDQEQQQLFRAALEDQEVYEALAAEQPLRDLLRQPAVRRELLEALEKPSLTARFAHWFSAPRPVLAAVAAALAIAVGALLILRQAPPRPLSQPTASPWLPSSPGLAPIGQRDKRLSRTDLFRELLALPPRAPFGIDLRLDRTGEPPRYTNGDGVRLTFTADRASSILLLEASTDGTIVELFPGRPTALPQVQAGILQSLPPAGFPPRLVSGPFGPRRVRLIAFPVGTDPTVLTHRQLRSIAAQLAIAEKTYEVVR
jgi:hypothetical protein